MARWKSLLVIAVVVLVGSWAVYAMAGDTTPGLHRLDVKELQTARTAKAANHGQSGHGTITKLENPVKLQDRAPKLAGTITYDTVAVSAYSTVAYNSYGNRFNTAAGSPVNLSGSVTHATFGVIGTAGATNWGPMYVTLYDQLNTTAASANFVSSAGFSWGGGPHTSPAILSAAVGPWAYSGSSFLLGMYDYNTNAATPNGVAALIDTGTTGGQGFHGYSMVYAQPGTSYTALGANVVMRATGDVLVPVELMNFTIQ